MRASPLHYSEEAATPMLNRKVVRDLIKILSLVMVAGVFMYAAQTYKATTAEQMRREASTQARLLLSMHDTNTGVMEVRGLNSEIYYASPAACKMLGYSDNELNGVDIRNILPAGFRQAHELRVEQAMKDVVSKKTPHRVSTMRCRALQKGGEEVEVVVRVFVSSNGIFALVNRYEDMTYMVMPGGKPEP